MDAIGTQENIVLKSLEQKQLCRSRHDILNSRLKNRERQRRYRARKRSEANTKGDSVLNRSIRPQEQLEKNGSLSKDRNTVHCKRNWKRDARNAHAGKTLEVVPPNASIISALTLNSGNESHCLVPLAAAESQLERIDHPENSFVIPSSKSNVKLGRRNWKAEARRKAKN
ncbi:uncharacterized protein LOC126679854 [Mercurialis annua]|uniref:uncharacterized protein LOC126679854 n=1 Tax=Mercurialis annua TaxID=3986 RepID=UPI002160FCE1|nr:uncharacterized protein LOC126679854 [Mercurialis annua]